MRFEIFPAIDLMGGKVVRLQQGDAARRTEYAQEPAEMAREFQEAGAGRIHVVDLDGAFSGESKNLEAIKAIRAAVTVEIEVGGGIRTREAAETLLNAGINYVVVGTKALEDERFLKTLVEAHGAKVIVGADARNGFLSTRGWTADTKIEVIPFLTHLKTNVGVASVIFTDIARDGMFTSPNYDALESVLAIPGLEVIASGGVGSEDDVRGLLALNKPNLRGVIVGKALYDGRVDLRRLNSICSA
ncbi:MAG: 1-(5-phosphoribosyl)-5-[(5-phosphoribosylamino)methylideneamino]imidazole-4-carboxamide isomerase [Candidatus Sumerlaeaceae bacterium]|nr:1-(5-phosphoribosyl)-5-[(5-phosphoribosylamino)methylideneamino]imidazole-4-carboxamide isomerase [Candidatus Sumerlaeaceae bacterium]